MKSIQKTVLSIIIIFLSNTAWSDSRSAFEIMQAVKDRYMGETSKQKGVLTLIDKKNKKKKRTIIELSRKQGEDDQSITQVVHPADLRGASFLSYDYDDPIQQDETWMYLPQIGKTKRLANSERKGYFLGSDFTYNDLSGIEVSLFDYKFLTEESNDELWVINALPAKMFPEKAIDETGYIKAKYWVDKKRILITKAQYWLEEGDRVKYFRASNIVKKNGIWTPMKVQMILTHNQQIQHASIYQVESIIYNLPVKDEFFNAQFLGKTLD